MKELSIFVDESGDFGEYDYRSPYYIISLVFHDQEIDISRDVFILEKKLSDIGWENHCVHAGPVIRAEQEYKDCELIERQQILKRLVSFVRKLDLKVSSFYVEKKNVGDSVECAGKLSKKLSEFIREHLEYFLSFDSIKVYYDNGQIELTKILSSVFFALLTNIEFRKVMPEDYKLFRVPPMRTFPSPRRENGNCTVPPDVIQ